MPTLDLFNRPPCPKVHSSGEICGCYHVRVHIPEFAKKSDPDLANHIHGWCAACGYKRELTFKFDENYDIAIDVEGAKNG